MTQVAQPERKRRSASADSTWLRWSGKLKNGLGGENVSGWVGGLLRGAVPSPLGALLGQDHHWPPLFEASG